MAQKLLYLAAILRLIAREWGRIGCLGFGGPPAHIAMLRRLCLERGWLTEEEFEHAVATCNLLPGPASTQLAIFCAWRVAGPAGALVGGVAFIAPGLLAVLALASVFLAPHPPNGCSARAPARGRQSPRWPCRPGWTCAVEPCALAGPRPAVALGDLRRFGAFAAAVLGAWVVLVLLGCGLAELALRRGSLAALSAASVIGPRPTLRSLASLLHWPRPSLALAAVSVGTGGLGALAWTSLKVGALSYGGGFVIIPLMRADAVHVYHWMTSAQFLDAVALGQVTPGPVTHTVAVVGYAAHGLGGGLLAALVAFAPSFAFILLGARHFEGLRGDARARAFLDGAGPAAIGAILGSAIPLALTLTEGWQVAVLGAAALALFGLRRPVPLTILLAALAGSIVVLAGGPVPH